jgi:hypothetical protein
MNDHLMNSIDNSHDDSILPGLDQWSSHELSRRGVLRLGGLTIAISALIAACGSNEPGDAHPARVGVGTPVPVLPDGTVTDGVLFRTSTSIHFSVIDGHNLAKKLGQLTAAQTMIVDDYIAANQKAIADLQKWTVMAGSKKWTCANTRFDRVVLIPITGRITGRPKQGAEEADIAPSDDPNRDAMALVHALEQLAAAMHQSFVPQFSIAKYRQPTIGHAAESARRAAALAMIINPQNLIGLNSLLNANLGTPTTTTGVATTTTQNIAQSAGNATTTTAAGRTGQLQQYYAIPSQFGTLSAVQLAIGAFSSGAQFSLNIETPSLNSFVYSYQKDC